MVRKGGSGSGGFLEGKRGRGVFRGEGRGGRGGRVRE